MTHNISLNDVTVTLRDDVLYTLTLINEKTKLVLVDGQDVDYKEVAKVLESYLDFSFEEIVDFFGKVESGLPILLESQNVNLTPYSVGVIRKDPHAQKYAITLIDMGSGDAILDGVVTNENVVVNTLKHYYDMGKKDIALFFRSMDEGLPAAIRSYKWNGAPYSIMVEKVK